MPKIIQKDNLPIHPSITCSKCGVENTPGVQYILDLELIQECSQCLLEELKERKHSLEEMEDRRKERIRTGKGRGNRPKEEVSKYMTPQEWDSFKANIQSASYHRLWTLIYLLGLRLGEALALKGEDFNFTTGRVRVRSLKRADHLEVSYKLPDPILKAFCACAHDPETFVFLTLQGKPLTNRTAWGAFKRTVKRAGLDPRLSPHSLRHAAGMRIWKREKDLLKVQKVLRHANMKTSENYMHITGEEIDEVVEDLGDDV